MSALEAIEAKRAARKAKLDEQHAEQLATDLEAVDALETEHGDSNVAVLRVPFTPGQPALCAARCPNTHEIKRYRDRIRKDGGKGDPVAAAEEIAAVCRVYPDADTYKAMLDARPGIHVQLGVEAVKLASGQADADQKS